MNKMMRRAGEQDIGLAEHRCDQHQRCRIAYP